MYIGIDLGGTNIAGGIVNEHGEILMQASIPTRATRPASQVVEDIIALIETFLSSEIGCDLTLNGIGIGIPGIADSDKGTVKICVNLDWRDVPFGSVIQERFNCPVHVENDATVAAVAEFLVGQKGKYENAVMLTLGTGIGGGVMMAGKMVSGSHGIASEIGHMIVGHNFYDCNCGRNGCLETFSSSTAIINYAKRLILESGEKSTLDVKNLTGKIIIEAAEAGDDVALRTFERMTDYLAKGLMNIVCMIDPEVILIGGGMSMAGDFLLNSLNEKYKSLKYYKMISAPRIEFAKLHNDAGIIGAAMLLKM